MTDTDRTRSNRYAKGKSGNPRGRPKGSKNIATVVKSALDEKIMVHENGQSRRIRKVVAMAKQIANKAAAGEPRAAQMLINMLSKTNERAEAPSADQFEDADDAVVQSIIARIRNMDNPDA